MGPYYWAGAVGRGAGAGGGWAGAQPSVMYVSKRYVNTCSFATTAWSSAWALARSRMDAADRSGQRSRARPLRSCEAPGPNETGLDSETPQGMVQSATHDNGIHRPTTSLCGPRGGAWRRARTLHYPLLLKYKM
jgi:hypothetical protein